MNALDLGILGSDAEGFGADAEMGRRFGQIEPGFDAAVGRAMHRDLMVRAQRGDALAGPAVAVARRELVPDVVVSSERPFGAPDAVTAVREYDPENGRLVRVFSAKGMAAFRKPRGLRFGPEGHLYCVARDEVVAFDFASGRCLGAVVRFPRLYGQALIFFPD